MAVVTDTGTKMMNLFCQACNEIFAIPSRRGRPPKYCTKCIDKGAARENEDLEDEQQLDKLREKARQRVDNLEMMLKSRGTHLSQHRHEWEK